jgi:hypothetical protein
MQWRVDRLLRCTTLDPHRHQRRRGSGVSKISARFARELSLPHAEIWGIKPVPAAVHRLVPPRSSLRAQVALPARPALPAIGVIDAAVSSVPLPLRFASPEVITSHAQL